MPKKSGELIDSLRASLEERKKELALLHQAALLFCGTTPLREQLEAFVALVPAGFGFPDRTLVRLRVGDDVFGTEHFPKGSRELGVDVDCPGDACRFDVACLRDSDESEAPRFLAEEEELVASLGRLLETRLQRNTAERRLEESERRFHALFDNEVDCVKVLDAERRLVEINPAGLAILGQKRYDDLVGETLDRFVHPDDVAEYRRLHREALNGRTARGRYRVLGRDNQIRFLESVDMPMPGSRGETLVLSITSDLTRLIHEEEKFRHVLDSSPDAMIIVDSRGIIRVVNRVCETMFGYTRYELLGQPVEMLLPEQARDVHRKHREHYARKPRVRAMGMGMQLKGRRRNGTEFPVEIALGPVNTPRESLVCATVRDLAGVREFELALRELADQVSPHTGETYLQELANFLSGHFGLDVALVGRLDATLENVDSLAVGVNGEARPNMSYRLFGTPCAQLAELGECFYDDKVQELFPDDAWFREVGAQGYAGVALHDSAGTPIGVISAISRKPLANIEAVESFFKLAAAGASAELERMRQVAAVQQSELRYSLAESGTADGLWDIDLTRSTVYYSPRFADLLGLPTGLLNEDPESFWKYVHPEDVERVQAARHRHMQHRTPFDVDFRARHANGVYRWFRARGKALRSTNDKPIRFTGSLTDIDEGKRHQLQLKAENTWLAKFAENAPLADLLAAMAASAAEIFDNASVNIWLLDTDMQLHVFPATDDPLFHPESLRRLLDEQPEEGTLLRPGATPWPRVQADFDFDRMRVWSAWTQGVPQRVGIAVSWPKPTPELPYEIAFVNAAKRLVLLALEGLRKEAELERQRLLFENLFDSAPEAMVVLDRNDCVLDVNSSFTELFQYTVEEARGRSLNELLVPPEFEREGTRLSRNVLKGGTVARESFRRRRDGTLVPVSILGAPVTVPGIDAAYFAVYRDQRSLHEATQRLDYQARHDLLTGLPNRYEFERRLQQALDLSNQAQAPTGVVYFDLDQFKVVNDSVGHAHGDDLIKAVAKRLRELVRPPNLITRLGGDEFAVLVVNGDQGDCDAIAQRIRETLAAEPFRLGDRTFVITASFGVVAIEAGGGNDAHSMLSLADSACFLAKERGRNRIQVYDPADMGVARRQEELDWVSRLDEALVENRFQLFYQRIEPVSGSNGIAHYEILLRMTDRSGSSVPPGVFIPPAERYNMMPRVDRWVLETVFRRLETLDTDAQRNVVASVNISGNTLSDESLPDFVRDLFEKHGVLPSCICFEITETAAIGNFADALTFIKTVRELGCQVALDDFGSGLSSFRYLKEIAPDYLKIDGSFIREIAHNRTDFSMVEAINRIGKTVGIRTVAEFVEDEQILSALRRIGVDYVQGYGVHRPEPWLLQSPRLADASVAD